MLPKQTIAAQEVLQHTLFSNKTFQFNKQLNTIQSFTIVSAKFVLAATERIFAYLSSLWPCEVAKFKLQVTLLL